MEYVCFSRFPSCLSGVFLVSNIAIGDMNNIQLARKMFLNVTHTVRFLNANNLCASEPLNPSPHFCQEAKRPNSKVCMGWSYSDCLGAISLSYAGALLAPVYAPVRNLTFSPTFALLQFPIRTMYYCVFYEQYLRRNNTFVNTA